MRHHHIKIKKPLEELGMQAPVIDLSLWNVILLTNIIIFLVNERSFVYSNTQEKQGMPKPPIDIANAVRKVREFFRAYHRAPSFEEIRDLFNYRSKASAHFLVSQLIEKNFLRKDSKGKILWDSLAGVKLLGNVQAGLPASAEEQPAEMICLDEHLVKNPERTFLVTVSGDSMIEAGIFEGDLVLVERDREPKNQDIIIAEVDGEWTLKYYEKQGGRTRLIPANKKYSPIEPKHELKTGGVIVAVIRKYK